MTKPAKVVLGIVTIWPAIYMAFFFVVVCLLFASFLGEPSDGGYLVRLLGILFPLHLGTIVVIVGLGAFYIYHLFQNDQIGQNQKALWAVVLLMGNMISMPVYWYLYFWRDNSESHHSDQASTIGSKVRNTLHEMI